MLFLLRWGGKALGRHVVDAHRRALLGDHVVEAVAQDGERPGAQIRPRREAVPCRPHPHQRILDKIVGIRAVAHQHPGEGPQLGRKRDHLPFEVHRARSPLARFMPARS
ncbi:hypothetical protein J4558_14255 [Leptolyngbya sp. 15MV]|nr:hypothetical protein J4558_14255 [Leptolyngbya sp. 15MV]